MVAVAPSSESWIAAAAAGLPWLLLDHAHCEKKEAQMALRHVARHADWPQLATRMSRLAREELVHFERVLDELRYDGWVGCEYRPAAGTTGGLAWMYRLLGRKRATV